MLDHEPAADNDEGDNNARLDRNDEIVELGTFRHTDDEQCRKRHADEECRQVEDRDDRHAIFEDRFHLGAAAFHQGVACRPGQRCRDVDPVIPQKTDHISGPANSDHRSGKTIFKKEQGPHDPCGELAHGGVAVGIGRAGHRKRRGKLCIAQPGKGADESGNEVGDQDGGTGVESGRVSGTNKNTRADDTANSEKQQIPGSECSLQFAGFSFALNLRDAFSRHDAGHEPELLCTRHFYSLSEPLSANLATNLIRATKFHRGSIRPICRPPKICTWRCGTSW